MEYEEDDDVSFAKWMSSFWGHNLISENEKEDRGHKKHQTRLLSERRASLPASLSSLHTTRLRASTKGSSSGHLKSSKEFQEDQDFKCHCHRKGSRTPSSDSSCPETRSNSIQETRSNSIQEFAESFEKQLLLKSKRSVSLQPEDMKERRERERLHLRKSKSDKKMGAKSEPRREHKEDEVLQVIPAEHNEQFPSKSNTEERYLCTGN